MHEGSGSVATKADPEGFARAHFERIEPELLDACELLDYYLRCFSETLLGRNKTEAAINLARDETGEVFSVVFRKDACRTYSAEPRLAGVTDPEQEGLRFSLNFKPEDTGFTPVAFKEDELVWGEDVSYRAKNNAAVFMLSDVKSQSDELSFLAEVLSDADLNPEYSHHAHAFAEIARGLAGSDDDELYEYEA